MQTQDSQNPYGRNIFLEACRRLKNHPNKTGYQEFYHFIRHTYPFCHSRESEDPGVNSSRYPERKDPGFRIPRSQSRAGKYGMTQKGWIHMNKNHARLNSTRYEGLAEYIAGRYGHAVEIGIGLFPDVAFALLKRGVRVFATDIRQFHYSGLKVIVDDIMEPDLSVYTALDLIYSLRPPLELVPYMVRLARQLSTVLIIKPLTSEHPGGQLICHEDTTFFLWNNQ
jgi:hypothetical protein